MPIQPSLPARARDRAGGLLQMDQSRMSIAGTLIFIISYLLIAARRLSWLGLDRPAVALLGATACVVAGVLSPAEAIAAVDGATILLLFSVMGMGAFLARGGFFDWVEAMLVRRIRTRRGLLAAIVWGGGLLAAFITNDAVCVLAAPLLVRIIISRNLPRLPFLLALATAANTGSVATLVGNPQNMLCAALGGLSYRDHLLLVGPVALAGLLLNHGLLLLAFRRQLQGDLSPSLTPAPPLSREAAITLGVILVTALAYTLGADLAWSAAGGFTGLMLIHRRDTRALWSGIDWSLLVFFAGLFIIVAGFLKTGVTHWFFARFSLADLTRDSWLPLSGVFLAGSNLVSNVPFILVVAPWMGSLNNPTLGWEILAMASTFAGNLTLLGSVANIIVAEAARDIGGLGFWEYLKFGLPLALITTLVGVAWLV